jgi:SSS family solute:Na+ symporter
VFLPALVAFGSAQAADNPPHVTPQLLERSVSTIRHVLDREQRFVKVHAAEYLLALGYTQGVKEAFDKELLTHGGELQYRIGIWRVLARCDTRGPEPSEWTDKLRDVVRNPSAPDRVHAVETLAKLGYRLHDNEAAALAEAARPDDAPLTPYALWVLANSDWPSAEDRLASLLSSSEVDTRLGAAYALRHLPSVSAATEEKLLAAARRERSGSKAKVCLVAAAAMHAPSDARASLTAELADFAIKGNREEKVEACQTLAEIGDDSSLSLLTGLLDDADPDARATAAYAILKIGRRVGHHLVPWDWAVILVYALGMLSVGWYYSRRTKTREQYLLGDRQMRPVMVGISLFASLISTISYLAWPGEVIKYGPMMMFGTILAYPLVGVVVGWLMIPFIMRLRVTSAYEILELRLGPSVRTLGSLLFLSLRLMWMSVIVYATTSRVLVPLLGLDPRYTPLVCAILAFVTIAYTAMGGLRAVVITDMIQSAILLGAAIVTVLVINASLGGVHAWWPSGWPAHWPAPQFGYVPGARVTMFGATLATFTWYVCTSASDQIAIQRYLATKDAKAARTVLFISLAADTLVSCILALVGLGLLAYFQSFPHLLPGNQTVLGDSDKLFSRFIVIGLPVGVSGLVVAGLLACAMSALSAGINSTCSVITVDILDRLRGKNKAASQGIKSLKYVSIVVGLIVVLLSFLVNLVQGNLLEICYKVVNLFTAPLAGLFFLAMFVPWARGFGTLVGAACGLTVVIAVSYWKEFTGTQGISFLWAMPLSLLVEVGVGALASLIPIGPRSSVRLIQDTMERDEGRQSGEPKAES